MIQTIVIAAIVVVACVLIYAATRPATFRVQRSASIKAPPEKIFAALGDFRAWAAWSPWEKMDPAMQREHGGAAAGKGATYAWQGNSKVGQGRMEIVETAAPSRLVIKLDFLKPFEAHNTAEFTLERRGEATEVTWAMHGPAKFAFRLMGVFMNMDAMIGKDFEAGLANLKTLTEK